MNNYQFEALVDLINSLVREAIADARPAHNRLAKTDGGKGAIDIARIALVTEQD